jgi:hypothetical protein
VAATARVGASALGIVGLHRNGRAQRVGVE